MSLTAHVWVPPEGPAHSLGEQCRMLIAPDRITDVRAILFHRRSHDLSPHAGRIARARAQADRLGKLAAQEELAVRRDPAGNSAWLRWAPEISVSTRRGLGKVTVQTYFPDPGSVSAQDRRLLLPVARSADRLHPLSVEAMIPIPDALRALAQGQAEALALHARELERTQEVENAAAQAEQVCGWTMHDGGRSGVEVVRPGYAHVRFKAGQLGLVRSTRPTYSRPWPFEDGWVLPWWVRDALDGVDLHPEVDAAQAQDLDASTRFLVSVRTAPFGELLHSQVYRSWSDAVLGAAAVVSAKDPRVRSLEGERERHFLRAALDRVADLAQGYTVGGCKVFLSPVSDWTFSGYDGEYDDDDYGDDYGDD